MSEARPRSGHSPAAFLPAALAGVVMLAAAILGGLAPAADTSEPVAAIFPPWWTARDVMAGLARSDAAILREGLAPSVVLATSAAPGLPDRLRAAGALLILDQQAAAGCLGLAPSAVSG